jgi:hypothetical protein
MYALVAATFFIAGGVKGVIGLGLPSVSLALLTATLGLYEAMAILLVPSFVTNLWQAVVGGELRAILARTWPFTFFSQIESPFRLTFSFLASCTSSQGSQTFLKSINSGGFPPER